MSVERLTKPLCGGYELPMIPMEIKTQDDLQKFHEARKFYESCAIRCGQYEDTGLEPDVCAEYRKFEDEAVSKGVTFKRIVELMNAEQDGRLVVLPCKVGDTVFTNFSMSGWYLRDKDRPYSATAVFAALNGSDDMGGGLFNVVYGKHDYMMMFRFSDIGKSVFLTREAAEAALSGGNHGKENP